MERRNGIAAIVSGLLLVQMMLLAAFYNRDTEINLLNARNMASNLPQQASNVILRIMAPPSNNAFQPDVEIRSSKKLFQDMPEGHRKTFYAHSSKICHVMIRALRHLGWTRVNNIEDAQLIWTYTRHTSWYKELASWQRYNHVPKTWVWNHKDKFAKGFRRYQEATGADIYFLPDTYNLNNANETAEFKERLFEKGGLDQPWVLKQPNVNQGKGITMLAPNSDALKESHKKGEEDDYIIQQYICDEMTWNERKFDTRMYWFVASLDPLIVFYIDGYARIGNAKYKENDFNNTRDHLTTHTFLGEEGKGSFSELADMVMERYNASPELQKRIKDPVAHIKGQYKEAIARLVDAFKGQTFKTGKPLAAEDAFEIYGGDFVIDNDLDVWLIEPQDDCGMDGKCTACNRTMTLLCSRFNSFTHSSRSPTEDHYFRLEMHHNMYYGMATILEEIWDKQEKGLPILPVKNTGLWEVVYADGWIFEYEGYKRSAIKMKCG